MIDKTIKNIKKNFNTLKRILTAKISEKKYLTRPWREYLQQKYQKKKKIYKVLEEIVTAKIANIKNIFFGLSYV